MDLAFKIESTPLRIDLSGIQHSLQQARTSSRSSSRSTEFQTVLDGFSTLKLNEAKPHEKETTKCFGENGEACEAGRLLQRRRNSTELTPGDLVMGFSQAPAQRVRRKSLPSLGLVAVDIQCSVPTKMTTSQSFPSEMTRNILGRELKSIQEIPAGKVRRNSYFNGATKAASKPVGGSQRGRRLSLGAQRNVNISSRTSGLRANQRRASCSKIPESPSEWRVKVHKRSLNISDDEDRLDPHIQTRRASYAGFPRQPQGRAGLLPSIGRRNSLVNEGKQSHTTNNGI